MFFSPQIKPYLIQSIKSPMYKLPPKFSYKNYDLRILGNCKKISKLGRDSVSCAVSLPEIKYWLEW